MTDRQRTTHEGEHRWGFISSGGGTTGGSTNATFASWYEGCLDCRIRRSTWSQGEIDRLTEAYTDLQQRFGLLYDDNNALGIEVRGLKETISEWQQIHGTLTGDVHAACQIEIERLRQDNAELSAECDQWGEKVAELWRLRKLTPPQNLDVEPSRAEQQGIDPVADALVGWTVLGVGIGLFPPNGDQHVQLTLQKGEEIRVIVINFNECGWWL